MGIVGGFFINNQWKKEKIFFDGSFIKEGMCVGLAKSEIKLDLANLDSTLDRLKSSMEEFTSYTTSFRSNTRDRLKAFNSDFIDKVDALLDNMNDDRNSDLIDQRKAIHQGGKAILDNMKEVDEKISKKIGSGSS